jgi:ATP-dependent exoDNAse (exonuclease V) beta subunit
LLRFCSGSASFDEALSSVLPATDDLTDDERAVARRILGHAGRSPLLARAAHAVTCRRELDISGHSEAAGVLTVTHGSIDLLFAEPSSAPGSGPDPHLRWVLVDYKTDSTDRPVVDFVEMYRPQLAVYEQLLAKVGIEVAEKWLLRLTPEGVADITVR